METLASIPAALKSFRETRLSALRPPQEFFDFRLFSRPKDVNDAVTRVTYNTRYFSGNYSIIIAALTLYAVLTDYWLLIALAWLVIGFMLINRFAPEPMQVGEHVVTQKTLYIVLFVIEIPLLWWGSPFGTFFWIVGASALVILVHACLMEPGVESEYSAVEEGLEG